MSHVLNSYLLTYLLKRTSKSRETVHTGLLPSHWSWPLP